MDAIFANYLLDFRRQSRFASSTTDIKCHATTNHRLKSVYQAATVAHRVHRAYDRGGEFQKEAFARVLQISQPRPVFTHGVWPVTFLSCASSSHLTIGYIRPWFLGWRKSQQAEQDRSRMVKNSVVQCWCLRERHIILDCRCGRHSLPHIWQFSSSTISLECAWLAK